MKTIDELRNELKNELSSCNHANDNTLAAHVNENIQWAWENWDIDFSAHFEGNKKPEGYTKTFMEEWIENEDFEAELEAINEEENNKVTITRSEIMSILSEAFDIPTDVELEVEEDGTVSVYCPGFIQPEWLEGVHYMSSDATIELYELGNEYKWEYDSEN